MVFTSNRLSLCYLFFGNPDDILCRITAFIAADKCFKMEWKAGK